jgi:ABC-type uncharacterized transport system YnjBCD substrate-binding protein
MSRPVPQAFPANLLLWHVNPLQLPGVMPSQLDPAMRSFLQDLLVNLTAYTDEVNNAVNELLQVVNDMTKP